MQASRRSVGVVAAASPGSWFPGNPEATAPHLSGVDLPANFGFDPLNLAKSPEALKWYVQAELQHARWAMLGVAGVLGAELTGTDWTTAGAQQYFADPKVLFMVQLFLFHFVEIRRLQDYKKPGSQNQDPFFSNNKLPDGNTPGYPGGIFDPAGFSKGDFNTLKLKELKNGRLAMLAFLGFAAQHASTGKGPLTNLADHLANPWFNNVMTNPNSVPPSMYGM